VRPTDRRASSRRLRLVSAILLPLLLAVPALDLAADVAVPTSHGIDLCALPALPAERSVLPVLASGVWLAATPPAALLSPLRRVTDHPPQTA